MEYSIGELLDQISKERAKEIFLSSLTFPTTHSYNSAQEITYDEKIDWKDINEQFSKNNYSKRTQDNILSIIEMFELTSEQCSPQHFDQVIISNNGLDLLVIKSKNNHCKRCIYINIWSFYDNLHKDYEQIRMSLPPIMIVGSFLLIGYLFIMT